MIVLRGHPQLATKARKATQEDIEHLHKYLEIFRKEAGQLPEGHALAVAANQVHLPMDVPLLQCYYHVARDQLVINPIVIGNSAKSRTEICLSCPDVRFEVHRYREVQLIFNDLLTWEETYETHYGLEAAICQHETDHLQGRCLWDHGLALPPGHL